MNTIQTLFVRTPLLLLVGMVALFVYTVPSTTYANPSIQSCRGGAVGDSCTFSERSGARRTVSGVCQERTGFLTSGLECVATADADPSTANPNTNPTTNPADNSSVNQRQEASGGLIQCGYSRDCTLCDIFILIRDIFNLVLQLLGGIGVLSIVIGGFYMVLSSGNPAMYQQGVQIITNAVLGLVLASASFLIFGFGLQVLGFQEQNFGAVFRFEQGQFFEIQCDSGSNFNDRGGWGEGTSFAPSGSQPAGDGAPVQCQNNSCLANNPGLQQAIDNNSAGIEGNILLALIDAGERCNPATRTTCNNAGFSDADCSCGFSQCTPRWRAEVTGIQDPQANCAALQNDVQLDVNCAAHVIEQTNSLGDARGNQNACSDIRSIASCYNAGSADSCATTTSNYCGRVEDFYLGC